MVDWSGIIVWPAVPLSLHGRAVFLANFLDKIQAPMKPQTLDSLTTIHQKSKSLKKQTVPKHLPTQNLPQNKYDIPKFLPKSVPKVQTKPQQKAWIRLKSHG